jgi:hypothetical protein
MMRLLLKFFLISQITLLQAAELKRHWWYDFEGSLSGADIQLSIYVADSGRVSASYCFRQEEVKFYLDGTVDGNNIRLFQKVDGQVVAQITGTVFINGNDRLEALWSTGADADPMYLGAKLTSMVSGALNGKRYADMDGNDEAVEAFMKKVRSAIVNKETEWLADNIRFPLKVSMGKKKKVTIRNRTQFISNAEKIINRVFMEKVRGACVCNMFSNYQGVMLGNGQVWIKDREGAGKSGLRYIITAINN